MVYNGKAEKISGFLNLTHSSDDCRLGDSKHISHVAFGLALCDSAVSCIVTHFQVSMNRIGVLILRSPSGIMTALPE